MYNIGHYYTYMKKTAISVVIPCYNEEKNIQPLIKRLKSVFTSSKMTYELIFVDDRSSDKTLEILHRSLDVKTVKAYLKPSSIPQGKSFSLIYGFTKAKYELIAMIDADMQYPPEAIPKMIQEILRGADVVVADRAQKNGPRYRKLTSQIFRTVFGKMLHGQDVDVQSGLKVFKSEIIHRITFNPTPWTFDLELLVNAKQAGYVIRSIPIVFAERTSGKSKVNIINTTLEIFGSTIKLKLKRPEVIYFTPEVIAKEGKGFHFRGKKATPHTELDWMGSALIRMDREQKIFFIFLVLFIFAAFFLNWHASLEVTIIALSIYYLVDILFNLLLAGKSFSSDPEISITSEELKKKARKNWPEYVILCPLYKEWSILPQFTAAIKALDYPKNKLKAVLLLEADDTESIQKISEQSLPKYFQVLIVPESMPKTKPKALNYALDKIVGEYAVIYDAEDIPDPLQLKKTVLAFDKLPKNVICIQAKLNFYNPNQNLLTRLFSLEYSLWFDLILPGLQSINSPIPLGGTSNHFRITDLRKLNGWDPFNVTEDADLGMRIYKKGYKTAILDSTTFEEANSNLMSWIRQRSRWMKGYMQTYLVHLRKRTKSQDQSFGLHSIAFHFIIGGKVLTAIINPLLWIITIGYFLGQPQLVPFVKIFFSGTVFYVAVVSLFLGNFLQVYYYMLAALKRKQWDLIPFSLFTPFYWLAISIATTYGLIELIRRPHHWHKTTHGLHIKSEPAATSEIVSGVRLASN